jgi:phosphate transport system permease protein
VGTAIFLSENSIFQSVWTVLFFLVELLAAILSVVYGLWGIFVLIPFLKSIGSWLHENLGWLPIFSTRYIDPGMLPAGIILTIVILPIITAIARESLVSVDPSL